MLKLGESCPTARAGPDTLLHSKCGSFVYYDNMHTEFSTGICCISAAFDVSSFTYFKHSLQDAFQCIAQPDTAVHDCILYLTDYL